MFAILGAIAGGQKDVTTTSTTSGIHLKDPSQLENRAGDVTLDSFNQLQGMLNQGPGKSDVDAGYNAQRDLAAMLKQYSSGDGAMPTAADISNGNNLASSLFQAQRVGLQQSFMDQTTAANRQAALMGRSLNDPILAAKLAQEQTRQSALLDANQSAYANQYAMNQPGQRLAFAGQRANILSGLATQAMQNRQALLSLGSQLQTQERNWRLATGEKYGNATQESGGGFKGAVSGAMAGVGTDLSIMNSMMSMGMGMPGGGGGGGQTGGSVYGPPQSAPSNVFGPGMQASQLSFMNGASPMYQMPAYQATPMQYNFGAASGVSQPRSYSLGAF